MFPVCGNFKSITYSFRCEPKFSFHLAKYVGEGLLGCVECAFNAKNQLMAVLPGTNSV